MLVKTEKLRWVTILHCQGRIVNDIATTTLREAVFDQTGAHAVVLDLAEVDLIDARGLGALLELREWAQSRGIEFKLMNIGRRVQYLLDVTCLDSVFEVVSEEMVVTAAADSRAVIASAFLVDKRRNSWS